MNSRLWVVGFDAHFPRISWLTYRAMLSFCRHNRVAGFTWGGDQLDFECISHHTKGKPAYRPDGAYDRDVRGFDKHILTPLESLLPRNCIKIYHLGNHERFERDLVEEQPELRGALNHVRTLRLKERGWKVIPMGKASRIGKLRVIHGDVVRAGQYQAKKLTDMWDCNVLSGHTHSPQMFTKVSPSDVNQKRQAVVAPILGKVNPSYLREQPTSWVNGFVVVELRPGGRFNQYNVNVTDGVCSYGGRIYRG